MQFRALTLSSTLAVLLLSPAVTAQEQSPGATEPQLTAEQIAQQCRDSVVTIRHYGRDGAAAGTGAGFVIDPDGLIATSLHVIGEARPVTVEFAGGRQADVLAIEAWDRHLDLAVLRVDASNLAALELGSKDGLHQGSAVVALGNPMGLERSIVSGIVSARRDFDGVEMIQLAIPVEPGNSGGPLLDMSGKVQGIINMKSMVTPNLAFAIPVDALNSLLEEPNPTSMDRWLTIGALDPTLWTPSMGASWRQRAGQIMVSGLGEGFGGRSHCVWAATPPGESYDVAVAVKLDDESGAAGLIFAIDDQDRCYGFYPSAGQLRLTLFNGPTVYQWTILNQVQSDHYRSGEWNWLRARVEPERIICYVNGHLVFESSGTTLRGGKAGLAKFRDTRAGFKNFALGTSIAQEFAAPSPELLNKIREAANGSDLEKSEVLDHLLAQPDTARRALHLTADQLEKRATELRQLAAKVHHQTVSAQLIDALSEPEDRIDLGRAALLLAKLDNPDVDVDAYLAQLDQLAHDFKHDDSSDKTDADKLAALNRFLFEENGFHGSRTDYYNRANSYLNEVLDDREGLPITLSVLYLELARRLEIDAVDGFPLPGHFVVRHTPAEGSPMIIDVFDAGKAMSKLEAQEWLLAFGGSSQLEDIESASKRDIIVRMLRNLLSGVRRNGAEPIDRTHYLDLIIALEPKALTERLERALILGQQGEKASSRQDLEWLIENAADDLDVNRLQELYRYLE